MIFWTIYGIGYLFCFITIMVWLYRVGGQIKVGDAIIGLFISLFSWVVPVGMILFHLCSLIPFQKVLIEKKKKDK